MAILISRILPAKKPAFHKMNDDDFITILSWLEDWAEDMKPLPIAVRAELEKAIKIHERSGNLEALRTYAFVYEVLIERWFPRLGWATLFLLILLTLAN